MQIVLDDWQKDLVAHRGHLVLCTGRQVGKTTTFAIKAAKRMLEKRTNIIIVSLTEDQAKLIIVMITDYLQRNHKNLIKKQNRFTNQSKVTLKNNSTALARPVGNTGDAVRGFTGDILIIDEASRMPELAFTAAKPTLMTTGGEIWMCSTPFGKKGYFYECFQNKNNMFKVFHINSEEVVTNRPIGAMWTAQRREGALGHLEQQRKDMSELQYGQEYLGLFLDDLRQYFSDEIINKCLALKRPDQTPKEDNYIGVDIARLGGDECAYQILNIASDEPLRVRHIENITKIHQLTTQTEDDILALNMSYTPRKIGIDAGAGALGVGIFDRLIRNPNTKRKVIAMNNRQITIQRGKTDKKQRIFKEDMYENLLAMMERGEIMLLDDEKIFTSLKSVQWELKEVGSITKIRIFGNYTHIAEGLVRAAWLAKKEKSKNIRFGYI